MQFLLRSSVKRREDPTIKRKVKVEFGARTNNECYVRSDPYRLLRGYFLCDISVYLDDGSVRRELRCSGVLSDVEEGVT